jgi:hypothetical protein
MSEERYGEFLELIGCTDVPEDRLPGGQILEGEFNTKDGHRFAVFNSCYGDGIYPGSDGNRYPVDAGCLSALPMSMTDDEKMKEVVEHKLGTVVEFDDVFESKSEVKRWTTKGTIIFGHIRIETGFEKEDDEDED